MGVTHISRHGGPVLNPYNNVMRTGGLCSNAHEQIIRRRNLLLISTRSQITT